MSWIITGSQKEPAGDPLFFSNVSLLLHGNGTNGSTRITDSSSRMDAATAVGNAQISTAQSKFGGSSIAFSGGNAQVTLSASTAFGFGIADFTVELFLFRNTNANADFFDMRTSGFGQPAAVFYNSGSTLFYFVNNTPVITASSSLQVNVWQHIAVSRSAGNTKLFVDGTQVGSTFSDGTTYLASPPISIGSNTGGPTVNPLNGYLDEVRITKGIARYTANFTPPAAPFPDA
jgi:hypothetical protein